MKKYSIKERVNRMYDFLTNEDIRNRAIKYKLNEIRNMRRNGYIYNWSISGSWNTLNYISHLEDQGKKELANRIGQQFEKSMHYLKIRNEARKIAKIETDLLLKNKRDEIEKEYENQYDKIYDREFNRLKEEARNKKG